ncbi:MAG: tRNA-dihydrouridine synthase [Flavonifractor plautii]
MGGGELAAMGYPEINLNLGCPSGTVVAKGKGSGFLGLPEELERFLDTVFDAAPCAVSIKTRLGLREPEEFGPLLALFRRYPLAELIVHPRVQKDMYKNTPRRAYFARALADSSFPVCYNGDLYTVPALEAFQAEFPAAERIMLGRGLAGDPALARKAGGGPAAGREELRAFHDQVYEGYAEAFGSRRNAMLRMKEVWFYLIHLFGDSQRHAKAIRKARDTGEYESAVTAVFRELELLPELRPEW